MPAGTPPLRRPDRPPSASVHARAVPRSARHPARPHPTCSSSPDRASRACGLTKRAAQGGHLVQTAFCAPSAEPTRPTARRPGGHCRRVRSPAAATEAKGARWRPAVTAAHDPRRRAPQAGQAGEIPPQQRPYQHRDPAHNRPLLIYGRCAGELPWSAVRGYRRHREATAPSTGIGRSRSQRSGHDPSRSEDEARRRAHRRGRRWGARPGRLCGAALRRRAHRPGLDHAHGGSGDLRLPGRGRPCRTAGGSACRSGRPRRAFSSRSQLPTTGRPPASTGPRRESAPGAAGLLLMLMLAAGTSRRGQRAART